MNAVSQEFERLFQTMILPDSEAPPAPVAPKKKRRVSLDDETRIRQAVGLFYRGEYQSCIESMRALQADSIFDHRIDAFVAASRALGLGETLPGLKSCVETAKKAGPVADIYCALGAVLHGMGDRARAHAVYKKGLKIDPFHPHLRARLRAMGLRRSPVLRGLSRKHPLNRILGSLRARFVRV